MIIEKLSCYRICLKDSNVFVIAGSYEDAISLYLSSISSDDNSVILSIHLTINEVLVYGNNQIE